MSPLQTPSCAQIGNWLTQYCVRRLGSQQGSILSPHVLQHPMHGPVTPQHARQCVKSALYSLTSLTAHILLQSNLGKVGDKCFHITKLAYSLIALQMPLMRFCAMQYATKHALNQPQ